MDKILQSHLEKNSISYSVFQHPPVFTVEESKSLKSKIPGLHTKCLFLKDNKSNFYLIALPAQKRLNTSLLRKTLKLKKLNFSTPEELKSELSLTPGSVSIFGLIYSKKTTLLLDKEVWLAPLVGFHPNINTSTLVISHEDLEKFLNSLNIEKEILEVG